MPNKWLSRAVMLCLAASLTSLALLWLTNDDRFAVSSVVSISLGYLVAAIERWRLRR